MASSSRPLDKNITEPSGRLKLEWDAYFSRIESQIADLAAQITGGGVPSTREVIAGAGLTGGGDLSTDRTFDVGQGTGITVGADSVSTNDSEIVHDNLSGFVADEHVAHSGVTLTAGAGLTGGGDITASRSFAVGAGTGITVNADDVAITAGGVGTTQLADEGVTMAKLEHAGAYTLLMRNAGTTGDPAYTKISALTDASVFASGDKLMIEESSGELRKIDYDDLPGGGGGGGGITAGTAQNTTSGTSVDFTGLPSGLNRITIILDGVSNNGVNDFLVQIGDSGGLETTGYVSGSTAIAGGSVASAQSTSGFIITCDDSNRTNHGHMIITRVTGNTWVASHSVGAVAGSAGSAVGGGSKTLSGELDRVRFLTSGINTFDAGQVNIFYE